MQETRDADLIPGLGRSPGEGNANCLQLFLPGKSHGQQSLVGYSPWAHRIGHEWVTEQTRTQSIHSRYVLCREQRDCLAIFQIINSESKMLEIHRISSYINAKRKNPVKLQIYIYIYSITNSKDMNLGKLWKIARDRESGHAIVHGVTERQTWHTD